MKRPMVCGIKLLLSMARLDATFVSPSHAFKMDLPILKVTAAVNGLGLHVLRTAFGFHLNDARSRILVVDDNVDIAQLMSLLLQHSGFDVRTLFDGRLVLAAARSFQPHFILMDIGMPGMNGYQVAEQLRGDLALKDVVIIALSAFSPGVRTSRSSLARFDHHLTKPASLDSVLSLLVRK
jgi:CheY-like chemotaxis protein